MSDAQDRLRAWTVVDELVLEICGMTKGLAPHGLEEMPAALRDAAIKSAIRTTLAVQASACDLGSSLRSALGSLAELRYFLYLARRIGLIDTRRYRAACLRHERAQRALRALLTRDEASQGSVGREALAPAAIEPIPASFEPFEPRKEA